MSFSVGSLLFHTDARERVCKSADDKDRRGRRCGKRAKGSFSNRAETAKTAAQIKESSRNLTPRQVKNRLKKEFDNSTAREKIGYALDQLKTLKSMAAKRKLALKIQNELQDVPRTKDGGAFRRQAARGISSIINSPDFGPKKLTKAEANSRILFSDVERLFNF